MYIFKHFVALLILSVIFVVGLPYVHQGAEWLLYAHGWIADYLKTLLTGGQPVNIARQLIALLLMPLVAGLIPAIFYWLIRRQWMPAFTAIVWTVWLLQVGVLAMAAPHTANEPTAAAPLHTADASE